MTATTATTTPAIDVALVTCTQFNTLTGDDRLLYNSLVARGINVGIVVWDNADVDWASIKLCVIRTVWDYTVRHQEVMEWIDRISTLTTVLNLPSILKWSSHKSYLLDLEKSGIPVVPTVLFKCDARLNADKVLREFPDHQDLILKPAIGSFANDVMQFRRGQISQKQEKHMNTLLSSKDMMLQPFISSVKHMGEVSVVFIGGHFSHALRKIPPKNDFRVQGGHMDVCEVTKAELTLAQNTLNAVPNAKKDGGLLYGRVDMLSVPTDHQRPLLVSEVEVFEPELFFRFSSRSVEIMTEAICARLELLK